MCRQKPNNATHFRSFIGVQQSTSFEISMSFSFRDFLFFFLYQEEEEEDGVEAIIRTIN
jgi:hypothetical protein